MRTYTMGIVVLAFVLMTTLAFAGQSSNQHSTTTTTTTTTQTTATGPEHNIEGCVVKEGADFFLIPERGAPFKIQSNQDLGAAEGHKVMVSGKETSLAGAATGNPAGNMGNSAATPAAGGTGHDLHKLADRQLIVDNVKSIADTCPVNWNPAGHRTR